MRITLVDRIDSRHGQEMDLSELAEGRYDIRFRSPIGRLRGYQNNVNLERVKWLLEFLGHVGTIYICPSKSMNGGIIHSTSPDTLKNHQMAGRPYKH